MILDSLANTDSRRCIEFTPAALLVTGIKVHDLLLKQDHPDAWDGIIDTGCCMTIVPKKVMTDLWGSHAVRAASSCQARGFDRDVEAKTYPKVDFKITLPGIHEPIRVAAAVVERENILIGRDALQQMVMGVDWKRNRWALRHTTFTDALRFSLWRWLRLR